MLFLDKSTKYQRFLYVILTDSQGEPVLSHFSLMEVKCKQISAFTARRPKREEEPVFSIHGNKGVFPGFQGHFTNT
jgi:hypothetical protein